MHVFYLKVRAFWIGAVMLTAPFSWAQLSPERLKLCEACHGPNGSAIIKEMPSLAGQPKIFIENQLVLIREGMRDIPSMKAILNGISDSEISALARHFSTRSLVLDVVEKNEVLFAKGEKLSQESRCGICHMPNYAGRDQMPRLAGQREDYLLYSMRQFQTGKAIGRDSIMTASLQGLNENDIQAIAHYLSRLNP